MTCFLFAEASLSQMMEICSVLDRFCRASSEKVSPLKTFVYFSKNVKQADQTRILSQCHFLMTDNHGKYSSIPIIHAKV